MDQNRTWVWVLVASLIALVVGLGAGWAVQQKKIDQAQETLAATGSRLAIAIDDLKDANKALDAAIAERDRLRLQVSGASNVDTSTRTPRPSTAPAKPSTSAPVSGRRFGYIKKIETKGGTTYVTFDQAEFLTGKAAAAAAAARGDESPPPNDYYIVNDNKMLRTYPLAASVKVTLTTEADNVNPDGYASDLATLKAIFAGTNKQLVNAKMSPYWFTLKSGVITAIEEQYLP